MQSEFELLNTQPFDHLVEKWSPVLDHNEFGSFQDSYRKKVTAALLENQERAMQQQYLAETAPTNALGAGAFGYSDNGSPVSRSTGLAGYDPVLISLVRRAMPNLMAYDIAGVQPMSAPTGLIFALKARYDNQSGSEALFQEPSAKFSGLGSHLLMLLPLPHLVPTHSQMVVGQVAVEQDHLANLSVLCSQELLKV
jgi:hypothetical protein